MPTGQTRAATSGSELDRKATVLEVTNLQTSFNTHDGELNAVSGVNFSIRQGEILGVVGESGCGKSVTAMSLMRLYDQGLANYSGSVSVEGENLLELTERQMQDRRGRDIAMIFQDPLNSLNPLMTIGAQIAEPLKRHLKMSRHKAKKSAIELLKMTGIPDPARRYHQYPHELSGGMRQRIMIAIALACEPKILIADEPTTALDVTIQAQVLDLIRELKDRTDMAVLFITHDLGVISELCERVLVMYLGEVIEESTVTELFERPLHPYTQGLLASIPSLETDSAQELNAIPGTVPPLTKVPTGCRFSTRCPYVTELCRTKEPILEDVGLGKRVRCWLYREIEANAEGGSRT